ncbi:MAG: hypothetical protein QFB87_03010 [Patescibacteria group bacterium]|nr:hypothetical protein [Patescibacteria group bacterium]
MPNKVHSESIDLTVPATLGYYLDQLVEVVYTSPISDRVTTYLGLIAARPEDKAKLTVICNKYGGERILTVAQTYTIATISQSIVQRHIDEFGELQTIEFDVHPADLVFDPASDQYKITAVEAIIPAAL